MLSELPLTTSQVLSGCSTMDKLTRLAYIRRWSSSCRRSLSICRRSVKAVKTNAPTVPTALTHVATSPYGMGLCYPRTSCVYFHFAVLATFSHHGTAGSRCQFDRGSSTRRQKEPHAERSRPCPVSRIAR